MVLHQKLSKRDGLDKAVEMLRLVHIPEPDRCDGTERETRLGPSRIGKSESRK